MEGNKYLTFTGHAAHGGMTYQPVEKDGHADWRPSLHIHLYSRHHPTEHAVLEHVNGEGLYCPPEHVRCLKDDERDKVWATAWLVAVEACRKNTMRSLRCLQAMSGMSYLMMAQIFLETPMRNLVNSPNWLLPDPYLPAADEAAEEEEEPDETEEPEAATATGRPTRNTRKRRAGEEDGAEEMEEQEAATVRGTRRKPKKATKK